LPREDKAVLLHYYRRVLIGVLLTISAGVFSGSASAEVLRLGGTGAATEMLRHLGAHFLAGSEIGLQVVVPSLGSSGGIRAVADGFLDVAVSGRPLKPQESAAGLIQVTAVRTPFVFATSHMQPNGLKSAEIASIFSSDRATWADGSPLRIILRPPSDSDVTLLGELFPGMSAALEKARQRPDIPVAENDQDNADAAQLTAGSLAGATFTQLVMEKRDLRLVALDGVEPTFEKFENGTYPYSKTLYFVISAKRSAAAERFVAFLRSPDGVKALRDTGNLPKGN
jgi:phosphate transport system substrate-binding protein